MAEYNYETAVKDFKSCILRIWTLNYSSCAFLTCLLKKILLRKSVKRWKYFFGIFQPRPFGPRSSLHRNLLIHFHLLPGKKIGCKRNEEILIRATLHFYGASQTTEDRVDDKFDHLRKKKNQQLFFYYCITDLDLGLTQKKNCVIRMLILSKKLRHSWAISRKLWPFKRTLRGGGRC